MEKERLHYIDIAKGLLILMVVYGHIDGTATELGFVNRAIEDIHRSVNIFVSFYMSCFFVITGYCTNFKKSFPDFLISSIKSIILPAFVFSFVLSGAWNISNPDAFIAFCKKFIMYGGDYWFLSALFLARLLFWVIERYPMTYVGIICSISFILGFVLSLLPHEYEYWWFVHSLCLMPYLFIGKIIKEKNIFDRRKILITSLAYFFIFIVTVILSREGFLRKDCFFDVPGVTQGFININFTMFLPLVILSLIGSVAVLGVSRIISTNTVLEFLGKNSLVIYCVQGVVLHKIIAYISIFGAFESDYWATLLLLLLSFILSVIVCSLISWIMNMKYIRYLLGKF